MTEAEWLASDDPHEMAQFLWPHRRNDSVGGQLPDFVVSDRKLRLWVEACRAVSTANDYVTDLQTSAGLYVAVEYWANLNATASVPHAVRAALFRETINNPFRPVTWVGTITPAVLRLPYQPLWLRREDFDGWLRWNNGAVLALAKKIDGGEACEVCSGAGRIEVPWTLEELSRRRNPDVRHVIEQGPEPRFITCPKCDWKTRLFDLNLMPMLHDALVDAGCTETVVLQHLLGFETAPPGWYHCYSCGKYWKPKHKYDDCDGGAACEGLDEPASYIPLRGPHVPGCWVIDLLLGRE